MAFEFIQYGSLRLSITRMPKRMSTPCPLDAALESAEVPVRPTSCPYQDPRIVIDGPIESEALQTQSDWVVMVYTTPSHIAPSTPLRSE